MPDMSKIAKEPTLETSGLVKERTNACIGRQIKEAPLNIGLLASALAL